MNLRSFLTQITCGLFSSPLSKLIEPKAKSIKSGWILKFTAYKITETSGTNPAIVRFFLLDGRLEDGGWIEIPPGEMRVISTFQTITVEGSAHVEEAHIRPHDF